MKSFDAVPLKNWPGYFISPDGKVWKGDQPKKLYVAANGYLSVCISRNNKSNVLNMHRLLALQFIGEPPTHKHEVCHINGNRLDNRLTNLRWGTRSENVQDAMRHGTATVGARNGMAKLTAHDVLFMRDMYSMGFTRKEISAHFPVSNSAISRALLGQSYKECR